jgi:hypothetical protein
MPCGYCYYDQSYSTYSSPAAATFCTLTSKIQMENQHDVVLEQSLQQLNVKRMSKLQQKLGFEQQQHMRVVGCLL